MRKYPNILNLGLLCLLALFGCSDSELDTASVSQGSSLNKSSEKLNKVKDEVWKINGVEVGMGFSKIAHLIPEYAVVNEENFDGLNYHFHFDGLQWTFNEDGILDFILIDGVGLGLDNGVKISDEISTIIDLVGNPETKSSDFYSYDFDGYEMQFYINENQVDSIRLILRNPDFKGSQLDQEMLISYVDNLSAGKIVEHGDDASNEIDESTGLTEPADFTERDGERERLLGNLKFKILNIKYESVEPFSDDILSIEVEIENIGSSSQVVNSGWFDLYSEEGFSLKQKINSFTSETLQPGKKTMGSIVYIVKTETQSFDLFYSYLSDLGKDMSVTWNIAQDDITRE